MARLGVVFNMRNQYKDTHNTFILTPFHSFNSFNSQTESMENQYKKDLSRPHGRKEDYLRSRLYVSRFKSYGTDTEGLYARSYRHCARPPPYILRRQWNYCTTSLIAKKPDLIIGTSMGGMYTEMLYGVDRICVNPAFQMGTTISETNMMGKQVFQNPRQDGVQEVIVTKALVKEYKEITEKCFSQVTEEEQQHVFGLFGDADPFVHTFELFQRTLPSGESVFMVNTDSSRKLFSITSCLLSDGLTTDRKAASVVRYSLTRTHSLMDMVNRNQV